MRLALYRDSGGGQRVGAGVATAEGQVIPTPWRSFDELFDEPDPLAAVQAFRPDPATAVKADRLLAPVVRRPQVIGTGGNYADHAAEATPQEFMHPGDVITAEVTGVGRLVNRVVAGW
jgi:2-keto-4-pentenoate hydratase/2-oxohepta-3-ene-1,7-dioic acid hydratase in catechol pathway